MLINIVFFCLAESLTNRPQVRSLDSSGLSDKLKNSKSLHLQAKVRAIIDCKIK